MSNSKTIKILALRANPISTSQLRLDEEIRGIKEELERSQYRDHFEFISEGAVRVKDLSHTLLKYEPTIVHFSGHGTGEKGLVLEDNNGQAKFVPTAALVEFFRQHRATVKCVFLNACYSEIQADAIYQQIDCVIGMNQPIGDKTAIQFAPKFYAALGWGRSFQSAFDYAKNDLQLDSNPEVAIPVLKIRQGAANLSFPLPQSTTESITNSVSQPPQLSHSVDDVTISGNNNPFSSVQAGGNATVSQNNSRQSTNQSMNFSGSTISGQVGQAGGDLHQTQYQNQDEVKQLTAAEVIQLIGQIESLLKNSALPDEQKNKAITHLEAVKEEVEAKEPDKQYAAKSLQKVTKVLKDTSETVDAGKNLWNSVEPILNKLLPWFSVASDFFSF